MKIQMVCSVFVFFFWSVLGVHAQTLKPATPYNKLNQASKEKLAKGEVLVKDYVTTDATGKPAAIVVAQCLIQATPKNIYDRIIVFKKRPQYMPRLVKAMVMRKLGENKLYVYQQLKIMWKKINVHLEITMVPNQSIHWDLMKDKKSDVHGNKGIWFFEPVNGGKHTLLTYSLYTKPKVYVPQWLKKMLIRGDVPQILKNIRKYVLSNGKWKQS